MKEHELSAALEVVARAVAPILARAVVDELTAGRAGDWVDQHASPLGARRHCRLIREGALPGVQAGRRWIAKRTDVDAYLERQSKRRRTAAGDDPAELARELGLRIVPGSVGSPSQARAQGAR